MYSSRTVAGGNALEESALTGHLSRLSFLSTPPFMPSHGMKCYLATGGSFPLVNYPRKETSFSRTARLLQEAALDNEIQRDAQILQPMETGAFQGWPHVPSPAWMQQAIVIANLDNMEISGGNLKEKRKATE